MITPNLHIIKGVMVAVEGIDPTLQLFSSEARKRVSSCVQMMSLCKKIASIQSFKVIPPPNAEQRSPISPALAATLASLCSESLEVQF